MSSMKNQMMKKLALLAILLNAVVSLKAQQDILVSQYMFNHLLVNPGYAGSKEYMQATLLYRKQWTGWSGAPDRAIEFGSGSASR